MIPESFLAPERLWALLAIVPLVGLVWWAQRRRRRDLVRFTGMDMLEHLAPARPGWRRGLVVGLFLAGIAVGTASLAQPAVQEQVTTTVRGRIMVVIDTSLSMDANDVDPDRLAAAQDAATTFVQQVDPDVQVGLISFNGLVTLDVALTVNHARVIDAIDDLELGPATAVGSALQTAVDALTSGDIGPGFPGAIVLLSDGATTEGAIPADAADSAAEAEIPVFTIAFGTPGGQIVDPYTNELINVPVADYELEAISEVTGGTFYAAGTTDALGDAYDQIQVQLEDLIGEPELVDVEITWRWVALAMGLLATSFVLGQLWLRGVT
jgi:Ca-activated chloride channel family protein